MKEIAPGIVMDKEIRFGKPVNELFWGLLQGSSLII